MEMLRSIVDYARISDEPWSDTMHRMKQRMDRSAAMYCVCEVLGYKFSWQSIIICSSSLYSRRFIFSFSDVSFDSKYR